MNPKVKLLALVLTSTAMLLFPNPALILIVLIAASSMIVFSGIHREFAIWLKSLLLVFILIVVLQSFTFGGLGFTFAGLYSGVFYSARLFVLIALVFLFVQTTGLGGLASAFDFLPGTISQVLVLALGLIPTVTDLTQKIINAQRCRGLSFRSPNIFRTYFPILVPLFAKTLDRSERMALAMQARGYEAGQ